MTDANKVTPLIFVLLRAPAAYLGVTAPEKAILAGMVNCMNKERNGLSVWPSARRLATETGYSEKTASRARESLHHKQLIKMQYHSGKENVCTINEDMIRTLADPKTHAIGAENADPTPDTESGVDPEVIHNPGHRVQGTPDRESEDPGQRVPLTANRTTKLSTQFPSFGCSPISEMVGPPSQRQLAVHAVVAGVARSMSSTDPPMAKTEQPRVEKPMDPEPKVANSSKPP